MTQSTGRKFHTFAHTENEIRGHHGILYEILPKDDPSKYALLESYFVDTDIRPKKPIILPLIELRTTGRLHLKAGLGSDGVTGFWDLLKLLRAAFVHDALCTLIILGYLDKKYLKTANKLFMKIAKEDKANIFVAKTVKSGLRLFSRRHVEKMIKKENDKNGR